MVSEQALEEVLADVRRKFEEKPRVAFAGFGKAGKSSLFNAIYGEQIARVSMRTDETVAPDTRERFGIDFTDTPGIGTARFSLEKVLELHVFEKQHLVIHVLNGTAAISAEDEALQRFLEEKRVARITVVNKVDLLDDGERAEFAETLREKLGIGAEGFLFVSAKRGAGVGELVERIADRLPAAMQDAFVAQQQASVESKDVRVRKLIYSKATVAAAVGAVPLPFADAVVIMPLQVSMVASIGYFYGVEVTRERALELLATLGAGYGFREGARHLVKLIPGYGSVVSAGVAFAGTVALGEAARAWFRGKMEASPEDLRETFKKAAARAKEEFAGGKAVRHAAAVAALRKMLESGEITQEEFQRRIARLDEAA
ncbi:GTPase [Vulgatibacter sp.]|uniref:GTPase n=1 Tax=Vulgatibacter sp. TaxID=1971226 RepID=UPI0035698C95